MMQQFNSLFQQLNTRDLIKDFLEPRFTLVENSTWFVLFVFEQHHPNPGLTEMFSLREMYN